MLLFLLETGDIKSARNGEIGNKGQEQLVPGFKNQEQEELVLENVH